MGRPNPQMENYLSNGRSPEGSLSGEDCLPINLSKLEMKWMNGNWIITDGFSRILSFGSEGLECLAAIHLIKNYAFAYQCLAIRPNASMVYFRR